MIQLNTMTQIYTSKMNIIEVVLEQSNRYVVIDQAKNGLYYANEVNKNGFTCRQGSGKKSIESVKSSSAYKAAMARS